MDEPSCWRFASAALSDPGCVRPNNEDAMFAGARLIAVADGVGGAVFGEVASAHAIEAVAGLEQEPAGERPGAAAQVAVERATHVLARAVQADESLRGMATTLTAVHLDADAVVVVHVGDSRGYRLRAGEWQRLTRDDSLVQGLVDAGALTAAEAEVHPARSVVVQALNGAPVQPAITVLDGAPGDRFLVCSDGLSDYVDEATIGGIVASSADPGSCCTALVAAALEVGAPDNVTCVVADLQNVSRTD